MRGGILISSNCIAQNGKPLKRAWSVSQRHYRKTADALRTTASGTERKDSERREVDGIGTETEARRKWEREREDGKAVRRPCC